MPRVAGIGGFFFRARTPRHSTAGTASSSALFAACDGMLAWDMVGVTGPVEGNVELHRRSVSAFNSRDVDGYIALAHPEIELHSVFAAIGGASYHGHDGVREWFRDLQDAHGAMRSGLVVYYKAYTDKDTCLQDLGVTENDLKPIAP